MKTNLLSLFALVSIGSLSHADTASMRGVFQLGAACPGGAGNELVRVHQNPDGTTSTDSSEFVVPSGMLLEVTDIEYEPSVVQNSWFEQPTFLYVQNRSTLRGYVAASWNQGPAYLGTANSDGSITYGSGVFTTPHTTVVFHLNSGVLVGPAARLCVNLPKYGSLPGTNTGAIIRGKLIGDGSTTVITPPPVGIGTSAM